MKFPETQTLRMDNHGHHIRSKQTQVVRFVKRSIRTKFVILDVQSEGNLTAVTEVTGRVMICGASLCSMQGSVHQRGVKGSGHRVL